MSRIFPAASGPVALFWSVILAVCLTACGQTYDSPAGSGAEPGGRNPTVSNDLGPSGDSVTTVIDSLDICALMPFAEVARLLDYDPSSGTAETTKRRYATDCTYSFVRDGNSDYAIVWAYPPGFWTPELFTEAENIDNLGDSAYLSQNGSFVQIDILLGGGLHLDIRANTPAQARSLAELAVHRLAPSS